MATAAVKSRPGSKAHARMVRMSASKVRVVLDLIRGKQVGEAMEILEFSERLASDVIGKCLASAVANAEHNDDLDADDLFISACYADEGPTLKRFRPRARGRAGRIHKQTCHITIEVSRYTEEELDRLRQRDELKSESRQTRSKTKPDGGGDRARRVAKSRAAAEEAPADEPTDDVADEVSEEAAVEAEVAETAEEPTDDVVAEGATEDDVVAEGDTEDDVVAEGDTEDDVVAEGDTEDDVVAEPKAEADTDDDDDTDDDAGVK